MPDRLPDRFFDTVTLSNIALSGVLDLLVDRYDRTLRVTEQVRAERGVPVTATIGILKALCIDQTIASREADAILSRMVKAGFYSPMHRISDLV